MRKSLLPVFGACCVLAGCGGSSSTPQVPTVQAARTFQLANFAPDAAGRAGKPTTVSFAIAQPDGTPLTAYKRGAGPHTGVHLIVVRDDLSTIDPPPSADRRRRNVAASTITFPRARPVPRRRRRLSDSRTAAELPALPKHRRVRARYQPQPLPPFSRTAESTATAFTLHGRPRARRRSRPASSTSRSPTRTGSRRASRRGTARSRTRSSSARARSTTSTRTSARPARAAARASLGGAKVTGSSTTPGKLRVGVLVPCAGHVAAVPPDAASDGHVLTAPFTLEVTNEEHLDDVAHSCSSRTAALVVTAVASAHAQRQPAARRSKGESQVFTLAVPTEKEDATTTKIELTPPDGFSIDSFIAVAGLEARRSQQTGSGEDAVITKVTWSGGKVPTGEDCGVLVPRPAGLERRRTRSASGRRTRTAPSSTGPGRRAPIRRRRRSRRRTRSAAAARTLAIDRARRRRARRGPRRPSPSSQAEGSAHSREPSASPSRWRRSLAALALPAAAWAHAALLDDGPVGERDGQHAAEAGAAHVQRGGRAAVRDRLGHRRGRPPADGRAAARARRPNPDALVVPLKQHRPRAGTSSTGASSRSTAIRCAARSRSRSGRTRARRRSS